MKKPNPAPRRQSRFQHGCHPDSLANLRGASPKYEVKKTTISLSVTPKVKATLKAFADINGITLSEMIERLGRLSVQELQQVFFNL